MDYLTSFLLLDRLVGFQSHPPDLLPERRPWQKNYDPRMMDVLLLYAYCVGCQSSRKIESAWYADLLVLSIKREPAALAFGFCINEENLYGCEIFCVSH